MVLPCAAQAPKVQTRALAGQLSGKRTEGRKIQLALALSASRPAYSVTLAMPPHRSLSMSASLKRTPLADAHVAVGARMVDFGGWEIGRASCRERVCQYV